MYIHVDSNEPNTIILSIGYSLPSKNMFWLLMPSSIMQQVAAGGPYNCFNKEGNLLLVAFCSEQQILQSAHLFQA